MKVKQITSYFEQFYPQWMAEENDPNGLHFGSLEQDVQKVMITLDVRPDVVAEAITKKVDLIIAKHPPLFVPAKRLTDDDPQTKMYNDLVRHNIAVYAAHTNLDIAPNGLNDWLLSDLGAEVVDYLELIHQVPYQQFTIYDENNDKIVKSLEKIKKVQVLAKKSHIQGIVPATEKENVIQLLRKDFNFSNDSVIWTELSEGPFAEYGIGRIGLLSQPMELEDFCQLVKKTYQMDHVKLITKDTKKQVQKVAICSGSGQKFYPTAVRKDCDVYITGDVYYHTGHDMQETMMPVIDAGHYIEHLMKPHLLQIMQQWNQDNHWNLDIIQSEINTNPFRVY